MKFQKNYIIYAGNVGDAMIETDAKNMITAKTLAEELTPKQVSTRLKKIKIQNSPNKIPGKPGAAVGFHNPLSFELDGYLESKTHQGELIKKIDNNLLVAVQAFIRVSGNEDEMKELLKDFPKIRSLRNDYLKRSGLK